MSNLQIKGIDDQLYEQLKELASQESRSVSQQVLFLIRNHLAQKGGSKRGKTTAEALLDLAGSWEDRRTAQEIVSDLRGARRSSGKLSGGL